MGSEPFRYFIRNEIAESVEAQIAYRGNNTSNDLKTKLACVMYSSEITYILSSVRQQWFGYNKWPGLYFRRIIHLGRAWAKNDSSSDNPCVYRYGQAGTRAIAIVRLVRRTIVDSSSRRIICLLACICTRTDYQTR